MQQLMPELLERLVSNEVNFLFFTPSWIIPLFSKNLCSSVFYRIMDCLVFEGYKVIYRATLALLRLKERDLMAETGTELLMVLNRNESPD
jgi:hypothetical protein